MKFSEVTIGARFSHQEKNKTFIYIKLDGDMAYFIFESLVLCFDDEVEVELVTKCENCRFHNKNMGEFSCPLSGFENHCHRISIDIDNTFGGLHQNPETFSCSLFEMKESK